MTDNIETLEENVVVAWKPTSMSPLEHLKIIKKKLKLAEDTKGCFAGRLDQMAQGKMIYLYGNKTKIAKNHFKHDKKYVFSIACGFSTDSQDPLGTVLETDLRYDSDKINEIIKKINSGKYMKYKQSFPICSSFVVRNKKGDEKRPLWLWKKLGRLDEVIIPEKIVELISLKFLTTKTIPAKKYIDMVIEQISKITSFPKEQIDETINGWKHIREDVTYQNVVLIQCCAKVKSGTYIRFLADMIGKDNDLPTHAFNITRTKLFYENSE